MPDARALLRAAQQAQASSSASSSDGFAGAITDPYASYHSKTRALRCRACGYLAIKHDSLWTSHAASKSHRQAVAKVRAEEEEKARKEEEILKRKREEEEGRAAEAEEAQQRNKKSKTENGDAQGSGGTIVEEVDPEWELFQKEVLEAASSNANAQPEVDPYAKATVEVAPQLTAAAANGVEAGREGQVDDEEEVETEAERRARLDREEKEEIYARFEEEQRLQDEAEERVSALKARLERLKAERASKAKTKSAAKSKGKATDDAH